MFSKDLELTIGQCYKEAREQRHEFMTVEHLLLALIENPSAIQVLRACSADIDKLGRDQAVSSSVFVTFVTEFTGFFAFLGLASLWLL